MYDLVRCRLEYVLTVQVIWIGVLQYCLLRVLMTIVAVVTQHFDLYCEASLNPAFSHIWVCSSRSFGSLVAANDADLPDLGGGMCRRHHCHVLSHSVLYSGQK